MPDRLVLPLWLVVVIVACFRASGQKTGCLWNDCDLERSLAALTEDCGTNGSATCDADCQERGGFKPGCLYHRCATLVGGQEIVAFSSKDNGPFAIFRNTWKTMAATLRVEFWDFGAQRTMEMTIPASDLELVEGGDVVRFSSSPPKETRGDAKYKRYDSFYLHVRGRTANQVIVRRAAVDPTLKFDPSGPPPSPELTEEWLMLQGMMPNYPGKLVIASENYGLGDGFELIGGVEALRSKCSACKMMKNCKGDATDNPIVYGLAVALTLAMLLGCVCFVYTGACWKCWVCFESCIPKTFEVRDSSREQAESSRRAYENHVRVMVFENQRRQ